MPEADVETLEAELQYYLDQLTEAQSTLEELRRRKDTSSSHTNHNNDQDYSSERDRDGARARLLAENVELRRALDRRRRQDRALAQDPQVLDARNRVAAVWHHTTQLAAEVATLEGLRRKWRRGLREVAAGARVVSALRGQQSEEQQELRETLRALTAELKRVEKRDTQLHRRFAVLQKQVMLNVTEKEVVVLRERRRQQERTIKDLKRQREEMVSRRSDMIDEDRRQALKEVRAKAKMEKEIEELKALVLLRDEKLGELYRNVGRMRGGPARRNS